MGNFDLFAGVFKSLFFGAAIALISCYRGFHCDPGAEGVGRAATAAFVYSFVMILLLDLFLGIALDGIYYHALARGAETVLSERSWSHARTGTPTDPHRRRWSSCDGVDVDFGRQRVLRDIDLTIPRGQTLAIIGESGCGKTVLLKTIIGLLRPTRGRGAASTASDLAALSEQRTDPRSGSASASCSSRRRCSTA